MVIRRKRHRDGILKATESLRSLKDPRSNPMNWYGKPKEGIKGADHGLAAVHGSLARRRVIEMATATHRQRSTSPEKDHHGHEPIHDPQRIITVIGRIASVLSVIMYVSYIPQIANNLAGHPGTPWQPLAAFFNCTMWFIYGFFKKERDWPIVIANVPGIIFGAIAFVTAFIH